MLARAIEEADWPRALVLALDAWRAARSSALADVIDALSARCPRTLPVRHHHHEAWMRAAMSYDPVAACSLVDTAHVRVHKGDSPWAAVVARLGDDPIFSRLKPRSGPVPAALEVPTYQRNRIERLCAFARWPDDPRVATVLARWFVHDGFVWDWPHDDSPRVVLEILAEELERIGDPRVVPLVASCIDRPRAPTEPLRVLQQTLAARLVDRISPVDDDPQVLQWLGVLRPAPPVRDERALWDAIAREPDAIAPRMVLADYLLERGDSRGEMFTLQCADDPKAHARADQLLAEHWNVWLGDLALIAKREESTFVRGMLDTVTIGLSSTPAWVYGSLGAHRELSCVRRVQQSQRITDEQFATVVAALADRPELELSVTPRGIHALERVRSQWPTRRLEINLVNEHSVRLDVFTRSIDATRAVFPRLEAITFRQWSFPDAYPPVVARLAAMPALRKITIQPQSWIGSVSRAALEDLTASMPIVEIT